MGRPTKLTPELVEQARNYLDTTKSDTNMQLPTIEGLSLAVGISRETVYQWEKENSEFSDIVDELRAAQGQKLIQNSLQGKYNPSISKLILSGKHGYVEKSEQDVNHSGNVTFVNDVPRPKSGE